MNHSIFPSRPWLIVLFGIFAVILITLMTPPLQEPFVDDPMALLSKMESNDTYRSLIQVVQKDPEKFHRMLTDMTTKFTAMDPNDMKPSDLQPVMELLKELPLV
jgi:hypothetical protein